MDRLDGECMFFGLGKVAFGPGKVNDIAAELARFGASRAVLVTGQTLAQSPLLEVVKSAMGDRCVGLFQNISAHGADDSAEMLATMMRSVDANALVSFGGSSVSDSAKVAIAAVVSGRRVEDLATLELFKIADLGPVTRKIHHICLPTTLSAGEYTPGGGATDRQGLKGAVMNPYLQVDAIINDPLLSAETSDRLWTSTGIRALDHAIEALYSQHSQSFTDALAEKAMALLIHHLPLSVTTAGDERIAHRGHCLTAAFLSNYAALNSRYGVSHAVGHKVGPMWNVPHGITSCISLPFAMTFMAHRHPDRFERIAAVLKQDFDPTNPAPGAHACAAAVGRFIDGLGLPRSLSVVGVPKDELEQVIGHVRFEIATLDAVGGKVTDQDVAALFDALYADRSDEPAKVVAIDA